MSKDLGRQFSPELSRLTLKGRQRTGHLHVERKTFIEGFTTRTADWNPFVAEGAGVKEVDISPLRPALVDPREPVRRDSTGGKGKE